MLTDKTSLLVLPACHSYATAAHVDLPYQFVPDSCSFSGCMDMHAERRSNMQLARFCPRIKQGTVEVTPDFVPAGQP